MLMGAAADRHEAVGKLLLEKGVDLNAEDNNDKYIANVRGLLRAHGGI
jgi:hypothetical protein